MKNCTIENWNANEIEVQKTSSVKYSEEKEADFICIGTDGTISMEFGALCLMRFPFGGINAFAKDFAIVNSPVFARF